jgi:2-polyprenyl-3-methyl-5-hydroxy-6-metoxy-1,4-benzoquinol methylase
MNKVAEHFENLSPRYAQNFSGEKSGTNFSFLKRLELACELTAESSGRLLDCACGTGEITAAILRPGKFSHATINDISPAMQLRARAAIEAEIRGTELAFSQSDIFHFAAGEKKFDLIACLGLLAHVGKPAVLFSHLRSLLAPGGRILLQTTLAEHPFTKIVRALSARRYFREHGYWISYFCHTDIQRAAAGAGLKIVARRRHTVGIPFGDRISARANFGIEKRLQKIGACCGTEALYLLAVIS